VATVSDNVDMMMLVLVLCHTCVKDAQNRAELYSENETRVSSTRHDATRVMPCHTWDFNARPLTRVKDARL